MALYPVPLGNAGPQEVSSLTPYPGQAQPQGQARLLKALSCESWNPSRESTVPTDSSSCPHCLPGGKSCPLSPASLLSLLPRAVHTGLAAWDRTARCSCPSCMDVLWLLPSAPSFSPFLPLVLTHLYGTSGINGILSSCYHWQSSVEPAGGF